MPDNTRVPFVFADKYYNSDGEPRAKFVCPFCKTVHRHGAESGFRVAHCYSKGSISAQFPQGYDGPASPFLETGYFLIVRDPESKKSEREYLLFHKIHKNQAEWLEGVNLDDER